MRREVSSLTGLDLPTTLIFDYPSVAAIASYVISKLPPTVAKAKLGLRQLRRQSLTPPRARATADGGQRRGRRLHLQLRRHYGCQLSKSCS